MHLILSRVKDEDLDELLLGQYSAFTGNAAHDAIYGLNTPVARADAKKKFLKEMHTDPADYWLKIVDQDSGKLVAASNWKIYPTWAESKGEQVKDEMNDEHAIYGFQPGSVELRAHEVTMEDYIGRRKRYTDGEAHVCEFLLPMCCSQHGPSAALCWQANALQHNRTISLLTKTST